MYICVCNSVTDSDIRREVDNGVRNMKQLSARTGLATTCGSCAEFAADVLRESVQEKRAFLRVVSAPVAA